MPLTHGPHRAPEAGDSPPASPAQSRPVWLAKTSTSTPPATASSSRCTGSKATVGSTLTGAR